MEKFIKTELLQGEYTFQLLKNKLIQPAEPIKPKVDDNGKIISPDLDFNNNENALKVEFVVLGSMKLNFIHSEAFLTIKPLENYSYPLVKFDFDSSVIYINGVGLDNFSEVKIDDNKNLFKSAWSGYQWYVNTDQNNAEIQSRFTIGKLKENGKIYMEVLWYENGKRRHYRLLS